jgi:hypothetical protein
MCGTLDRVCDRTAQNNGNIYSAFSFSHTLSDMLACALTMAKMVEPSSQISKHPDYMGSSPTQPTPAFSPRQSAPPRHAFLPDFSWAITPTELEFCTLTKRRDDRLQLEFKQTIYKDTKTGK